MHEVLQHAEFRGRQTHFVTGACDRLLRNIRSDHTEAEGRLSSAFSASNQRPDTRDQFAEIERFRHIIIGTGVEQFQPDSFEATGS